MKKLNYFIPLILILFILTITSCKSSESDATVPNSNEVVDNTSYIPTDVEKSLGTTIPIYKGSIPPKIEGTYRINTLTGLSYSLGNKQIYTQRSISVDAKVVKAFYKFMKIIVSEAIKENGADNDSFNDAYAYFKYSGQNDTNHTINCAFSLYTNYIENGNPINTLLIDSIHSKRYIQGSGNNFTTYDEYTYTSKASSKLYKLGFIVSGEKSGNTIKNIQSCLCIENEMTLQDILGDFIIDTYCALRDLGYININKESIKGDLVFLNKYDLDHGDNKSLRSIVPDAVEALKKELSSNDDSGKHIKEVLDAFSGLSDLDALSIGNNISLSSNGYDLETTTWPQQSMVKFPAKQIIELLNKIGISRSLGYSDDNRDSKIDFKTYTIDF